MADVSVSQQDAGERRTVDTTARPRVRRDDLLDGCELIGDVRSRIDQVDIVRWHEDRQTRDPPCE